MNERVYVYALLRDRPGVRRVRRRRIEIVGLAGLQVALERRSLAPALSESALRMQHEIIVRLWSRAPALLPVRFGALLAADELEAVLRRRRRTLVAALERVGGRAQMTVRLFGRPEPTGRVTRPARTGTAFLRARQSASRHRLGPAGRAIQRAVGSLAHAHRVEGARGTVILTLHHLIDRSQVASYRRRVRAAVAREFPDSELKVSGPFPPFAFAPEILR